jgi:predicted Fe-Mo cluster-binding NifX family protein
LGSIILTTKNNKIVDYDESEELVVYDMDSRKIVARLKKPSDPSLIEDLLEEHDPWIIVSGSMSPEVAEVLRDIGVKIEITNGGKLEDYISEVFV